MKKVLIIIGAFILLTGCKNDISIKELDEINDKITDYFINGGEYTNLSSHYVDEQLLLVIVELADNSKEEQRYFKDNIIKSKHIKFIQGGPYTTSGLDTKNLETYIGGLIANYSIIETTRVENYIEVDISKIHYSKFMKNRNGDVALLVKTNDEETIKIIDDYFKLNYKGYKKGKIENNFVYVYNGSNDFDLEFKTIKGTIEKKEENAIIIKDENNEKYIIHYNISIDLNVGDKITVKYEGNIAYSNPGQLKALYIKKE